MYEFVARDVDPPFTLRTHSQVTLSLDRSEVVKLASTYANELLHVVCGGSAELFLKNLFNDGGETIAEAINQEALLNDKEGIVCSLFHALCIYMYHI